MEENESTQNQSDSNNIEYWEWKYRRTKTNNTLLVIIDDRYEWIKRNSIDLPAKKCREISKKCWVEKCPSNSVKITNTISRILSSFPEEYYQKTKNSSKKGKMIILWCEKKLCESKNISMKEISENKLLIAPFRKEIPESTKEKYGKRQRYDGSIRKYRFREAFLPREMMQQCDEQKPGHWYQNPESPDLESEELERWIHEN